MEAEAITLNLRGVTQTYKFGPLPAEHRVMEPLFFSQPAFLLIPLSGVSSVLLAPVKTCIQQASLQIPAYLLCHRAGSWYSDALRHRRRGGRWDTPLFLFWLYVHHDPFFSDLGTPGQSSFTVMLYLSADTIWSIQLRPENEWMNGFALPIG